MIDRTTVTTLASTRRVTRCGLLAATSAVALLAAVPAFAQNAPPAAPMASAEAPAAAGPLGEIVVTAQRRSEKLQDVPIAVIAASSAQLRNSGIQSTQQLPALVPGLNVRTTNASFQPTIRGIGTPSYVVENPVALYVDGIYLPQQREGLRDLNDIAQIAVLKGPQGTLFGRNATGGVIQITTRAPQHELSGEAGASIDNYATFRGDAYLTGGLSDAVATSLSAQYATQGNGWGKSLTTGRDEFKLLHQFSVRSKTLFDLGEATDLTVILDYMDRKDSGSVYQPYPGTSYLYAGVGPLDSRYETYAGSPTVNAFRGGGVSAQLDHDLGFAKLVAIGSYRQSKSRFVFDNSSVALPYSVSGTNDSPNKDYTGELQLVSTTGGSFTWVAGLFYYHNRLAVHDFFRAFSGPLAPLPTSTRISHTSATETTESVAPFAQAVLEVLPDTKLTGGVRWTYEKRELDGGVVTLRNNGTTLTQAYTGSVTIREPTFRASLDHRFTSKILGYVSFSTGVKSGGFNILNPANTRYLPEKLKAYEVGLKTELGDVRLNLAGFYYDYRNIQVVQFVNTVQTLVNGAGARLYGVDVDLTARLAPGLTATGGLEAMHAAFTSYRNAVFSTPRPTGGAAIRSGDASGDRLPLAQNLVGTLALDYEFDAGASKVHLNATGNYNGDYYFESDNFLRQPAYVMLNISAKLTLPDGLEFSVWGRNLLDESIITQASSQPLGYPTNYSSAPRTVGVTARYSF